MTSLASGTSRTLYIDLDALIENIQRTQSGAAAPRMVPSVIVCAGSNIVASGTSVTITGAAFNDVVINQIPGGIRRGQSGLEGATIKIVTSAALNIT